MKVELSENELQLVITALKKHIAALNRMPPVVIGDITGFHAKVNEFQQILDKVREYE